MDAASPALGPDFFKNAEAIAKLYRQLVLVVGLQLLLGVFRVPVASSAVLSMLVSLILIGTAVALAVSAYQLSRLLGSTVPILWAILMFIPCLNILGLLAISSKAQAWCRQFGVKVGLLGPTKESIEELRRRVQTSNFD